ncbi:restriction endonuclease subunit S [Desulfonatronovibrio magnus]|uniref:restriction endonuclease subunit S n=1 Tax=Desulfonatronovibrio magnus TaxID=698827 RepID=UPI000698531A|nr:restriction endonuclease subunit S [Desulfonatronovibrio magnus]
MPDKLKKGWTKVAFGDVVRQVRDRVNPEETDIECYVAGEHMDTDDLKIRRWGIIGDGYLGPAFHMRFKPGHVLYGSRRTYLRKVALADFEGITANTTFVLEPKDPSVLLPELLPFIMQTESFHDHSIKQSKGSVNPYVNFSDLAWYEFALPPLDEQRRIAEVLGASYDLYGSMNSLLIDAWKLVRSFAHSKIEMFKHNKSNIKSLSEVATIFTGRTPSSSKKGCWGNSIPFATPGDMDFIEPNLITCQRALTEYGVKHSVIVPAGSVLVVCIGSTIGKVALCNVSMTFNQQINAVVPKDMDSMYLFMCLIESGRQLEANRATTAVPIVNKSSFSQIKIPVPSKDIQQRISESFLQLLSFKDKIEVRMNFLQNKMKIFLDNILGGNP